MSMKLRTRIKLNPCIDAQAEKNKVERCPLDAFWKNLIQFRTKFCFCLYSIVLMSVQGYMGGYMGCM